MRPIRTIFLILFLFFKSQNLFASQLYWVFFKDKAHTSFNPYTYFDPKAIERRLHHGITLFDHTDFPLNQEYVSEVLGLSDSMIFSSRWFNAILVFVSEKNLTEIEKFSFVKEVIEAEFGRSEPCNSSEEENYSLKDLDLMISQTESMGASFFRNAGLNGKGVRIAIFDAGFPGVDKHPAFAHLRDSNKIILTHDFVRNNYFVYGYNGHGTAVLSCIAGKKDAFQVGMATGSEFLLARTERAKLEPFSEEVNWLAAVEWADKNGADIINSSLGYTYHRYFREDMDGKKSFISRAANMAASKGILVVNAAGNDGTTKWKKLGTPADADSVLAIGGIDPETGIHTRFSSYGPTADMRRKPNVSAFGHVFAAKEKGFDNTQGTSFSSPLVAGFAACAMQSRPGIRNMELFAEIEKSSTLYPYYDYSHGYGIPQASYFTNEKKEVLPSFDFQVKGGVFSVAIREGFMDTEGKQKFFYHIENHKGYLDKYFVLDVEQNNILTFEVDEFHSGETIRLHYKGYTHSYTF